MPGSLIMESDRIDTIAVAATFTAEPVASSVRFWMRELDVEARLAFAPYDQVFQQLLDETSLLRDAGAGLNVLLLRLADWLDTNASPATAGTSDPLAARSGPAPPRARPPAPRPDEDAVAALLVDALAMAGGKADRPTLLIVCPSAPDIEAAHADRLQQLEARLHAGVQRLPGVRFVSTARLRRLYPVHDYYDADLHALGDAPYTAAFFAALGTLIARSYQATRRPARKVLALDCDMTLWRGVCGEDGPEGIEITASDRDLQSFVRARRDEGMLLCLCSKNNAADVHRVFEQRRDMPLRRDDFVGEKVNWLPKHENLRALAGELRLALDSFVFVDDDPVECAAMQAALPEVLTVHLPRDRGDRAGFLEHIWAFDRFEVTREDLQRSARYRTEAERQRARASAPSLAEFLAGLDLRISFSAASGDDLARASQLSFRTNQMNLTTVRRSAAEIRQTCAAEGRSCLVVAVQDRFGDYGTVGVMIFAPAGTALDVETFLLSCRALGRGVEHRMVAHLGQLAQRRGLDSVTLRFAATPSNGVAGMFLRDIGAVPAAADGPTATRFELPAARAAALRFPPDPSPAGERRHPPRDTAVPGERHDLPRGATRAGERRPSARPEPATHSLPAAAFDGVDEGPRQRTVSARQADIAERLRRPPDILAAVLAGEQHRRPGGSATYQDPDTPTEREMARIWKEVLNVDRIGRHDNFFELGGDSLSLTRVMARFPEVFGMQVSFEAFFDAPTVAQLAHLVAGVPDPGADDNGEGGRPARPGAPAAAVPVVAAVQRVGNAAGPAPSDRSEITTLGMVTSGRVDLLERGLSSYIDNLARFGRQCRYVVVDDADDALQADTRALLGRLAKRAGVDVHYAGGAEKRRFAERLVRHAGLPSEVVDFALFGPEGFTATPGANRNALLLETVGEQFFSTDDDTVCRIAAAPQPEDGVAAACGVDPAEHWFFGDRESALRDTAFVDEDVLAPHEALLGRDVTELLDGEQLGGAAWAGARGEELCRRVRRGGGRVEITLSGLLGDCGWGAPFGYWIGPMGPLLLEGASRERLIRCEESYRSACSSREIRRVVRRARVGDHAFSMSTFFALDNRALSAPVVPVQRGQDLVFGATLWACAHDGFFGHVPRTLLHAPVGRRSFWPGEVARTASGIDTARLLLAGIDSWRSAVGPAGGAGDRADALRALGNHLVELGSLAAADFATAVGGELARSNERFIAMMEAALQRSGGEPAYWAADVRGYLQRLLRASARPDYIVPLDLQTNRTPREAAAVARRLMGQFGGLLLRWPEMCAAARDLKRAGQGLSVEL